MAVVTAGPYRCDVHPLSAHVLDRPFHQPLGDASLLEMRVDGDHVHDTHTFVERVECNSDKPHRPPIRSRDKYVSLIARTGGPHSFLLNDFPVWLVEPGKDRVSQDLAHRLEDGLPRPEGEIHDRIQVESFEGANVDSPAHGAHNLAMSQSAVTPESAGKGHRR